MTAVVLELPPFDLHLPSWISSRVVVDGAGCWLWTGPKTPDGYGRVSVPGAGARRRQSVHRVAYERLVGPIPEGLQIDHLCRVRNCINPSHLEPVTAKENVRRSTSGDYWRNKTHCPRQHPYDEANTRFNKQGRRFCRACAREHMRRQRAAKRPVLLDSAPNESPAERRTA